MSAPLIAPCRTSLFAPDPTLVTARARGFTLIEVLVAVLVLAIGLLGLASLQLQGLRETHAALLQTQAGVLATDMAERLQAGPLDATDLQDWKTQLARRLPAGDGGVTSDTTANTVQVLWTDRGAEQVYTLSFMP